MISKEELLAECQRMIDASDWDEQQSCSVWPEITNDRNDCGNCTVGARMIARKFGGKVFGYRIDPHESKDLVAFNCFGHDFAIVGDYLVDWWAWEYEQSLTSPVLHIVDDAALIAIKYKPRSEWNEMAVTV